MNLDLQLGQFPISPPLPYQGLNNLKKIPHTSIYCNFCKRIDIFLLSDSGEDFFHPFSSFPNYFPFKFHLNEHETPLVIQSCFVLNVVEIGQMS